MTREETRTTLGVHAGALLADADVSINHATCGVWGLDFADGPGGGVDDFANGFIEFGAGDCLHPTNPTAMAHLRIALLAPVFVGTFDHTDRCTP